MGRAIALVLVAVTAHVWIGQGRREARHSPPEIGTNVTRDGTGDVNRTAAEVPAAPVRAADTVAQVVAADRVNVVTQMIPAATSGLLPPRARPDRSPETLPTPAPPVAAAIATAAGPSTPPAAEAPPMTLAATDPPEPKSLLAMPLEASRHVWAGLAQKIAPGLAKARVSEPVINAAPIVEPNQNALVLRVLNEYAAAYDRLDVAAAKAVYPSVNDSALRRAFNQLESQRVTFQKCGVTIAGSDANARCQGEAAYRPRVGSRALHRASREWTFALAKADDGWQITKATVR